MGNEEVYEKTKAKKWSQEIKRRRLLWYGHLCRLNENTPVRRAYEEAKRKIESKLVEINPKRSWKSTRRSHS